MRITYNPQKSLFEKYASHELGQELCEISKLLDEHPEIYAYAHKDLNRVATQETGRPGLSVEMIVRAAILKQSRQLSYEDLAFHLEDSQSFHTFARLDGRKPKKSVLHKTISLIRPETWEKINREFLKTALIEKIETGDKIRIDSTGIESNIHYPTDSSLLVDSVRVMTRLLKMGRDLYAFVVFPNRNRRAKGLGRNIKYSRAKNRKQRYRQLLKVTQETLSYFEKARELILPQECLCEKAHAWLVEYETHHPLIIKIIDQTKRRVLTGESVPASEKVISLFEPHADIISKGNRETIFGHKLNLISGKSSLILDAVIEKGNPADSERFLPMLERQNDIYNGYPKSSAADGGYASKENLQKAKDLGVHQVMFHKKRGLQIEDMVKSKWAYRQLRNFRAGVEANISCLKRAYGFTRCLWRGFQKFKAYIWSGVVAYNLMLMARIKLKSG